MPVETVAEVVRWVQEHFREASTALPLIRSNHIDGAILRSMNESEIEQHMLVESFGLRRKMHWAISELPPLKARPSSQAPAKRKSSVSVDLDTATTRGEARQLDRAIKMSSGHDLAPIEEVSGLKRKAAHALEEDDEDLCRAEQLQLQQGIEASKALNKAVNNRQSTKSPLTSKKALTKTVQPGGAAKGKAPAVEALEEPKVGSTVYVDWNGICRAEVVKKCKWPGWYTCHFKSEHAKAEKANVMLMTDSKGENPLKWCKTKAELQALLEREAAKVFI